MNWKDAADWSDRYRSTDTPSDVLIKLMEEVGELASAYYRLRGSN